MLYLEIEDAKMVSFDFAVNKQGMLQCNVFSHLKKFDTSLEVANKFILLLNNVLDDAEKCVYVNADEMPSTKSDATWTAKKALTMKTSDEMKSPACIVQPPAHPIQTK